MPESDEALTLDLLTGLVESRLHLVPPFRRRLAAVPLGLDQPYWIEDPDFDIEFHARELAFPACGAGRLGHRTTLGADGTGGDPVEQQVGHGVGLLLEHKVADAVQRLEAVLPADITTAVLNALLHDRDVAVAPYEHRWDGDLGTGSAHILEWYGPVPVEGGGERAGLGECRDVAIGERGGLLPLALDQPP